MALLAMLQMIRQGTKKYLEELETSVASSDPRFLGSYRIFRPEIPPDEEGHAFFDCVLLYELNETLNEATAQRLPEGWKLVLIPESILDLCGIDPEKVKDYAARVEPVAASEAT